MQKAIFALAFQDEANDEEEEKRLIMTANGIADTFLAGSGYYGMIAAMGKNVILELIDEFSEGGGKDTREALVRSTAFSPPINAKLRNFAFLDGKNVIGDKIKIKELDILFKKIV